jgi:hypothetical protein
VFANTGAGAALLFDVQGNPALTVSGPLTSGFSFVQPASPLIADGSGKWNSEIFCTVCGSGTRTSCSRRTSASRTDPADFLPGMS